MNTILCDVTEQDIPLDLVKRLQQEKQYAQQKEARDLSSIKVVLEDEFKRHKVVKLFQKRCRKKYFLTKFILNVCGFFISITKNALCISQDEMGRVVQIQDSKC